MATTEKKKPEGGQAETQPQTGGSGDPHRQLPEQASTGTGFGVEKRRDEGRVGLQSPLTVLRRVLDDLTEFATPGYPRVEVTRREDDVLVEVDLPGVRPDEVHVEIDDDVLVIEGERSHRETSREGNVWTSERMYGAFQRAIRLPAQVQPETAEARFENGVLEVEVKLAKGRSRGRSIAIKAGPSGQR